MRRGVRVRRVVRRFELWSVAKVAFFFHLLCYLLTVGVLAFLWLANSRLGTIDKLEKLFEQYGFGDNFTIHGDVLLRVVASVGAVMVVIATVATIALAFFYNGISLVFGGLVVSVLEERPGQRRTADRAPAAVAGEPEPNGAATSLTGPPTDTTGPRAAASAAVGPMAGPGDLPGDLTEDLGDWTQWQRPAPWTDDGADQPAVTNRPA